MKIRTTTAGTDDVRAQQWGQGVLVGLCWSAAIFEMNQDLKNRLVPFVLFNEAACNVLISNLHLTQSVVLSVNIWLRAPHICFCWRLSSICYLIFFPSPFNPCSRGSPAAPARPQAPCSAPCPSPPAGFSPSPPGTLAPSDPTSWQTSPSGPKSPRRLRAPSACFGIRRPGRLLKLLVCSEAPKRNSSDMMLRVFNKQEACQPKPVSHSRLSGVFPQPSIWFWWFMWSL